MSALGKMENLVGKNILILDEVDDTRTTLEYAVGKLEKDAKAARLRIGPDAPNTKFSTFVLPVRCPLLALPIVPPQLLGQFDPRHLKNEPSLPVE